VQIHVIQVAHCKPECLEGGTFGEGLDGRAVHLGDDGTATWSTGEHFQDRQLGAASSEEFNVVRIDVLTSTEIDGVKALEGG
jgi:hypothetical protein